ncbi:MAG: hypothetical protein U5K53_08570 [Halanaerobiales bacterium]|nr:hypothetical protein [Halanaerobiales bacterium]
MKMLMGILLTIKVLIMRLPALASDFEESWNLNSIDRPDIKMTLNDEYVGGSHFICWSRNKYTVEIENTEMQT